MDDSNEEESDLFRSITEGSLSEDQWELFKRLQQSSRKYVSVEGCELDDSDVDDTVTSESDVEEKHLSELVICSGSPELAGTSAAAGTSVVAEEPALNYGHLRATELTKKYIDGEISFTEFTDLLENCDLIEESREEGDAVEGKIEKGENEETIDDCNDEEEEDDDGFEFVDDEKDEDYELKPRKKRAKKVRKRRAPSKTPATTKEKPTADVSAVHESVEAEKEYEAEVDKQRRRHMFRRNRLPRDLQGLVGEANMRFAQGDYEVAIKMCMDVIQLAPSSPEPFQTLGMIYEELGDKEKFLQFSLISAHLSPNDADEWVRLAEMSVECNDLKQAVTCYGRAIRCEPNNLDLMWTRCKLFEQLGETKKLVEQLNQIMSGLKSEDGEVYLKVARGLTKVLHDDNQLEKATSVMVEAFEKHHGYVTSEDINFLMELQMKRKYFDQAIRIIVENCGVVFRPDVSVSHCNDVASISVELKTSTRCSVPEGLPIDLAVKLIICLIHVNANHLTQDLLAALLQESAEEMGDLYLDVAEAYIDVSLQRDAVPLLATLVSTKKYNLAAIWLHYGECLSSMGQLEEAANAYRRVVELAPTHLAARMTLSGLLQQLGHSDDALNVLRQDEESCDVQLEPQLLLQRSNLLYNRGQWDEFFRVSKLLHATHIKWPKNLEELKALNLCTPVKSLRTCVKNKDDDGPQFSENNISAAELWQHYLKVCNKLFELKQYDELEFITKASVRSSVFTQDKIMLQESDFRRLLACYFNKKYDDAYNLVRRLIPKFMDNHRLWNLFNHIVTNVQDLRHNRFCIRQMFKKRDHLALGILNGNNALVSGSYNHALGEYVCVLKSIPDDPFINLCIGLIFVHMTCQKFYGKKHLLVVQACAFLDRYLEFRGDMQETYYNIGRAMHQMNICHAAEHYYLKALECPPPIDDPIFDLRFEIAFNLSLIYQNSHTPQLAKMYLEKYCVV